MGILAGLLEQIAGPWLRLLIVPALGIGLLTFGHQYLKARADAKAAHEQVLIGLGKKQCLAEVELVQTRAQLIQARAQAEQAAKDAAESSELAEKTGGYARELENQIQALSSKSKADVAAAAAHCLSDGVRTRIWGRLTGNAGGTTAGASGGGSPGKPTAKAP